jgi:hypothetical protein
MRRTAEQQVAAMLAEERPALLPLPLDPIRYYQYGEAGYTWTADFPT